MSSAVLAEEVIILGFSSLILHSPDPPAAPSFVSEGNLASDCGDAALKAICRPFARFRDEYKD